ncbi:hypothetical protein BIW11_10950, partial [Tropilaelaps mercedesae]
AKERSVRLKDEKGKNDKERKATESDTKLAANVGATGVGTPGTGTGSCTRGSRSRSSRHNKAELAEIGPAAKSDQSGRERKDAARYVSVDNLSDVLSARRTTSTSSSPGATTMTTEGVVKKEMPSAEDVGKAVPAGSISNIKSEHPQIAGVVDVAPGLTSVMSLTREHRGKRKGMADDDDDDTRHSGRLDAELPMMAKLKEEVVSAGDIATPATVTKRELADYQEVVSSANVDSKPSAPQSDPVSEGGTATADESPRSKKLKTESVVVQCFGIGVKGSTTSDSVLESRPTAGEMLVKAKRQVSGSDIGKVTDKELIDTTAESGGGDVLSNAEQQVVDEFESSRLHKRSEPSDISGTMLTDAEPIDLGPAATAPLSKEQAATAHSGATSDPEENVEAPVSQDTVRSEAIADQLKAEKTSVEDAEAEEEVCLILADPDADDDDDPPISKAKKPDESLLAQQSAARKAAMEDGTPGVVDIASVIEREASAVGNVSGAGDSDDLWEAVFCADHDQNAALERSVWSEAENSHRSVQRKKTKHSLYEYDP